MVQGFAHEKAYRGKTDTWLTPLEIVKALGSFQLDPCAFPCHWTAEKLICEPMDGLNSQWEGRVWLNPPYGPQTGTWLEKLASHHGGGTALVFARTDTRWFQSIALKATGFLFLKGRIKFLKPDMTSGDQASAPSVLISFGMRDLHALAASGLPGIFIPGLL